MDEPKVKTLNLDRATWEQVRQIARAEDRTIVAVVRRAISAYAGVIR